MRFAPCLMRKQHADQILLYATSFIGLFYILTVTIGFGAAVLVGPKVVEGVDTAATWPARCLPRRSSETIVSSGP